MRWEFCCCSRQAVNVCGVITHTPAALVCRVILAAAVAVGVGWNAATLLLRGFLARMGAGAVSGSSLSMTSRSAVERRLSGDGSGSQSSKAVNEGGAKPLLPCLESCMPLFGPSPPGASVLDSWVPIADAATVDEAVQVSVGGCCLLGCAWLRCLKPGVVQAVTCPAAR